MQPPQLKKQKNIKNENQININKEPENQPRTKGRSSISRRHLFGGVPVVRISHQAYPNIKAQ